MWLDSKGTTQGQLEQELRCPELLVPANKVQSFFKSLTRSLKARGRQQRVHFISTLYVTSVGILQDTASKTLREYFYVSIRALLADARPDRTRNEINRWFETTSRGHVPSVMSENLSTTGGAEGFQMCAT